MEQQPGVDGPEPGAGGRDDRASRVPGELAGRLLPGLR